MFYTTISTILETTLSALLLAQMLGYFYLKWKSKGKIGKWAERIILFNITVGIVNLIFEFIKRDIRREYIGYPGKDVRSDSLFVAAAIITNILQYSSFIWLSILLRFRRIQVVLCCEDENTKEIISKIKRSFDDVIVFYISFALILVLSCVQQFIIIKEMMPPNTKPDLSCPIHVGLTVINAYQFLVQILVGCRFL